jgi:hypothetical protein
MPFPHSVRFAATSPPLRGVEEKSTSIAAGIPLPRRSGERWLGEAETEWGSTAASQVIARIPPLLP